MPTGRTRAIDRISALQGIALLLVCVLSAVSTASAEERRFAADLNTPAAPTAGWTGAHSAKFYQGHFLPELGQELGKLGTLPLTDAGNQPIEIHPMYDEYTKQARRRMERATEDSVKSYLLETTSLGKLEELFSRKSGPGPGLGQPSSGGGDVSLGLGISSGLPEVHLRYKLLTASLRVSVGANGDTMVDFKTGQMGQARLVTRYSPGSGEYGLAYTLGF